MSRATYTCTALLGTNKKGRLRPDENGYYEVILGALDIYNSVGAFYPFEAAKHLFESSSSLMRRIANGACRAEWGHPKKLPGMSQRDYMQRICTIYEDMTCAHIAEVCIDSERVKDKNGKPVIAIIGKVKPSGPYGDALREQLENGSENVCFSIRSLTDDVWVNGTLVKNIKLIVGWDYVNEPGLYVANKYMAPSLEAFGEEHYFTAASLGNIADVVPSLGMGLESSGTITMEELAKEFGWDDESPAKVPATMKW